MENCGPKGDPALQQVNITLGTAGHIDHGKTALVRCLTGCETDRLKEEKERGMSIDLGFAPCKIADMQVGIVDVPGHENFIKTMVAGVSGMDGVILVVAADDGVMPQTREHLEILTLLGIRHGIVALTKIDRVAPEHRERVRADVASFLHGTFLESAPILPLSNITGEGFDGFLEALWELVAIDRAETRRRRFPPPAWIGPFPSKATAPSWPAFRFPARPIPATKWSSCRTISPDGCGGSKSMGKRATR